MNHANTLKNLNDICDKFMYAESFGERIEERFGKITWLLEDGCRYSLNFKGELIEDDVRKWDED